MTPLYVDTLNKSSARQIASDKTQQATTLNYANAVNKIESVPANLKPQIFLNLQSNLRSQPEAGGEQLINQKVTHDSQLTLKTDPVEGFINQWIFKEGISSEQLQKIEQLTNLKVPSIDIVRKLQLPLEKVRSIERLVNIKTLKQKKRSTARGTAEKQKIILRSVLIDNIGAHTLRNKRKIRYDHTVGLLTEYLTHPELGALIQAISTISCSKESGPDKKRNCRMAKREWFEKHFGKGTNQEQTHIDHDRDKQINNKIEEIINSIFNDEQVSQKALTRICSGHEMTSSNVSLTQDNRASVLPANNRPNETSSKSSRKRPGDSTDNPAQSKRRATNNTEADRQSNNQVQVYSPGLSSNTHAQQTPHPDQQQNIPSDSGSFAESHFIQPVDITNKKVTHGSQLTLKTDPTEGFINQWIFTQGISSEQLQTIEQLTNWKVLSTDIAKKLRLPLEKVSFIERLVNIKTLKQKKQSTARGTAEKQKIILRSVLIDNIAARTIASQRGIRYDHIVGLLTEHLTHPELGALIQAISTISCSKASWLDKKRNCCMAKREWFEKHFGKGTNQEQTHIDHDRDKQINNKIEEIINSIFNDEQVSQKALTRICSGHEMTSSNVSLTQDNRASVLPANNRPNETSSKSSRKRPGDSTDNPAQSKRRATNNTEADRQSNNQVQVYSPGLSSNTHAQQTPHPDQQQNIPSDSGSFAESHFIQPVDITNKKVTHGSQLTLKTDPTEGFINQWIFTQGISSEQLQTIEQLTNWKVLSTNIAQKLRLPLEKVRSIEQLVNIKTLKQKKRSTARSTAEKQKIILRSVLIDNIAARTIASQRGIRYDHIVGLLTEHLTHPELGALIQAISTISCSKASWSDKKRNCCMAKREWFEKHFGKGTNQEQTHIDHDREKQINNKIEEIINSIFNDEQGSQKALTRICSGHEMTSSNVSLTQDNRASVLPANNRPNETSSKSSRKRPGDSTDNPAQSKRRATNNTEGNNPVQVYSPSLSSNTHAQQTPHPDQQQNIPSDSGSFAESHFIQPVDITNEKVTHGSQLTLKTDPTEGFINQWIFKEDISSEQVQQIEQLTNWKVLSTDIAEKLQLPLEKVRSIEQLVNIKTLKQKKQSTARGTAEKQKSILRDVLIDNMGVDTLIKIRIPYDHTVGLLTEHLTHPKLGSLIQAISTIFCRKVPSLRGQKIDCCLAKREWFEKLFGKSTSQEQTDTDYNRDEQIDNKIEEIINSIFNNERDNQKVLTRICSGHKVTSSNVYLTPDNRASVLPANNRPNETSSKSSRKRPGDSTDNPAQSKRRATNNTEADRQSNNPVQVYSPGLSSNTHAQQTPHPDQQQKNSF